MKFLSLAATLALFASPAALAADARPAKPEMKLKVPPYQLNTNIYNFPTGLRIMVQSDRSYPTVGVFSVVNHGSADDPKDLAEVAHFVEHTWFRSVHGDLPPIMDVIQDVGTVFNATTHNDWTDYQTYASSRFLPQLLRLESLRLTEPYKGVTEEQISVEREVIRNEWRRRNEQNFALFANYLFESVYPEGHGYHVSSTHETIDNIKLKNLQDFFDSYYKAHETTIFVVGDLADDVNTQTSLIFENIDLSLLHPDLTEADLFQFRNPNIPEGEFDENKPGHLLTGAWDPADRGKPEEDRNLFPFVPQEKITPRITDERPPVPALGTAEIRTRQWPLDSKMVVVGWSLPGGYRSDHWNLQVLGNLAGMYVSQGFAEDIDRKRVGDVFCASWAEVTNTTFFCGVELKDKKLDPERVRDRIIDQLPELWNPENAQSNMISGFNFWLGRSRNELLAQMLNNVDEYVQISAGRANDTAVHAHYTGKPTVYSDGMTQVMNIDAGTLSELANKYLKRDRAATVILEPLKKDEIDTTSDFSSYDGASSTDVVIRSSDDLTQVTDDDVRDAYLKPDLEELIDFKLDNGLRVVVYPHGEAPVVNAAMYFRRNYYDETKYLFSFAASMTQSIGHDPLPVATQTNFFIWEGTPGLNPGYGMPLTGGGDLDALYMLYRAPSGNLDSALWMMREEIETARPYVQYQTNFVEDLEDGLKAQWFDPEWHLDQVASAYLYPDHPASQQATWADVQNVRKWGNTQINDYLARHFRPDNATLFIVGNIDPEEAKKQAETYFSGWKPKTDAQPIAAMTPPRAPSDDSKVVILDDPGRTQSQMYATCRLNFSELSEQPAVSVLGSLMRNRTFQTLRIQEGLAYSPGAYTRVRDDGAATLGFYSLATNSGVGRTLEFFKQMVDEVSAGDVDDTEITLHKLRNSREEGVYRQSVNQMMETLIDVVDKDAGWDLLTDTGDHIASVNKAQLTKLLEGCADHMIVTIQGPKDVVTPQLDERGIDYEVLEWSSKAEELLWTHDPKAAKKREKEKQKKAKKAEKDADKAEKKETGDAGASAD